MDNNKAASILKKGFIIVFGLLLLAGILYYFIAGYTYSEGNRAGLLIKFSRKGYIFKTYEGELNLGGLQPAPNTVGVNMIWKFSVRDKAVAEKLMKYEGKYVSLHYKEVIKNFFWQGETRYFVDDVEEIKR
ncbi:MAG: hypothetical protein RMJ53_01305 [Chitinophagales bacterium]|nr:hypothetical protein [Chitinophagales bacterium]MDW8272844.1 hypothetical protein [Chitinophagales bacterium]